MKLTSKGVAKNTFITDLNNTDGKRLSYQDCELMAVRMPARLISTLSPMAVYRVRVRQWRV